MLKRSLFSHNRSLVALSLILTYDRITFAIVSSFGHQLLLAQLLSHLFEWYLRLQGPFGIYLLNLFMDRNLLLSMHK